MGEDPILLLRPARRSDEVWHLHLTYTQSYWIDFCRNTLGKVRLVFNGRFQQQQQLREQQ